MASRRLLPLGWRDVGLQLSIWFGFLLRYQLVRGIADRDPTRAWENGLRVVGLEERVGDLFELTLQRIADSSGWLTAAVRLCLGQLSDPRRACLRDPAELAAIGFKAVHAKGVSGVQRVD